MRASHQRFADKYFETLNATQSAIHAGYSEKTAKAQGYQLLQREDVQEYLEELKKELALQSEISKEKWISELSSSGFSNIKDLFDENGALKQLKDIDFVALGAISSIETFEVVKGGKKIGVIRKIKLHDKLSALDKIGKHLGFYEKNNEQKKPTINYSELSDDALDSLMKAFS